MFGIVLVVLPKTVDVSRCGIRIELWMMKRDFSFIFIVLRSENQDRQTGITFILCASRIRRNRTNQKQDGVPGHRSGLPPPPPHPYHQVPILPGSAVPGRAGPVLEGLYERAEQGRAGLPVRPDARDTWRP